MAMGDATPHPPSPPFYFALPPPPPGRSYIWKLFFCHGQNLAILRLLCPFFRLLANLISLAFYMGALDRVLQIVRSSFCFSFRPFLDDGLCGQKLFILVRCVPKHCFMNPDGMGWRTLYGMICRGGFFFNHSLT